MQVKYGPVARFVNGMFHDKHPVNFPYKRTGKTFSDKLRNMEKSYQKEYKRGRRHKAQMSTTGAATEEHGAEVGEHVGTGWQLFDEFFLAMYHQSPTDPSHQHALGLVDESNLSESDGEAGSPPSNNGHVACIVFASVILCCTRCETFDSCLSMCAWQAWVVATVCMVLCCNA